jgi:hypothetical protein
MEQFMEWFTPQREALLEFLREQGLNEKEPLSVLKYVCPTWFLTAKAYPFLRFTSERLGMAGNLEVYLCDTVTKDDVNVEYVWRYTPDGSAEDIEVARWLLVRGCSLNTDNVEHGKLRSTHLLLKSHNPKHVFEDLGEPTTSEPRVRRSCCRGHTHREYSAYDFSWQVEQVLVVLPVPIERVFWAGGVESVELSRVVTSVPYDPFAMEETRRGTIQFIPRAPWNLVPKLDTELLTLDVYRYNNSSEEWEYSPAHFDARVAALPEAWQQKLCEIAQRHRRTVMDLKAEFFEAFIRSYRERWALDHWLERSREALALPRKDFRQQLSRWRGAAVCWEEIAKLFFRMKTDTVSGLDATLDPRIYEGFDPFAETPQARDRLAKAKASFVGFEQCMALLNASLAAIIARQKNYETFRQQIYAERQEKANLRRELKRQGKWFT